MTAQASTSNENAASGRTLEVAVLMGGPSAEREVSLASGRAVADALESVGHRVRRVDIRPDDLSGLAQPFDVAFVALHGTWGEDGQLQAILEQRGVRYTGCGPEASALAMDKVRTKRRLEEVGVPTAPFEHVTIETAEQVGRSFPVPAVVKPVSEGSSVDCLIAKDRATLVNAVARLTDGYGQALVERYLGGAELTVGVLAGEALPVCQIRPAAEFYDYHAKYQADTTEYVFDIGLPDEALTRVQHDSVRAFEAAGCRDMARIDWIVESTTGEAFCLEINTIPGFTDHSLLPKAAARAGIDFAELCDRLVRMAMDR